MTRPTGPGAPGGGPVIRVVLVDDQALVRTGLRMVLEAEPDIEVVRTVASGDGLIAPAVTRRLIAEFARAPAAPTPPPELGRLTDRERAVLELVARGRSNAEIARDLVAGPATVKTHVGRVLTKLGLRDRVEAVIWAYEAGLVQPGR
jgi:DNA-binding NarL/FixJ family response regulator